MKSRPALILALTGLAMILIALVIYYTGHGPMAFYSYVALWFLGWLAILGAVATALLTRRP